MGETFVNLLDYAVQYWDKILALVGGTTGIGASLWVLVKYLTPIFIARANKKNGVNTDLKKLQSDVDTIMGILKNLPNTIENIVNTQLSEQTKAKYDKVKNILNINEIVEKSAQIESVVNELVEVAENIPETETDVKKVKVVVK